MATRIEQRTTRSTPGSRSRVWARVGGVLATVLLLGLLGSLAYLRAWPPLRIVMSASMEPAVDTGDVAVLQASNGDPQVGDVVLVPVPQEIQDSHRYPPEVLHRIIEITPDGLVRTQGDNLAEPDPFGVPVSSVQGRMVTVIPGVGKAFAFITSPFGLAWLAAGIVIFGIIPFVGSQRDIIYAVEEYGHHLRSHTQILKSMSAASQELSATVVELRRTISDPGAPIDRGASTIDAPPPPPPPPPPPMTRVGNAAPASPVDPPPTGEPVGRRDGPLGDMFVQIAADDRPVLYDDSMNPLVDPIVPLARSRESLPGSDPAVSHRRSPTT